MKKILLVEDSIDDQILTRKALEKTKIKCNVTIASDGLEALGFIQSIKEGNIKEEKPHLIIIDLKLPKINGLELLEKIRSIDLFKYTPIVILSTSKEESDIVHAYELKANSYVRKPVEFSQFVHKLGFLVEYWLDVNEVAEH